MLGSLARSTRKQPGATVVSESETAVVPAKFSGHIIAIPKMLAYQILHVQGIVTLVFAK